MYFRHNHHGPRSGPITVQNELFNLELGELLSRLGASREGLSAEAAEERMARFGTNELVRRPSRSPVATYFSMFLNPLVLVLLAAGAITAGFGELHSAIIIGLLVLLSVTFQFIQEYRSERAAKKLSERVTVMATAIRDGTAVEIPLAEIVPGDVVQLGIGDIVPADCRVLAAKDFFVDQAALTGESFPVEKAPRDGPVESTTLTEMNHVVFFGTNVISGTATALAVGTNGRTEYGRIAKDLVTERPETEFQRGIRDFTGFLVRVIGVLVAVIFLLNAWLHHGLLRSLLFAAAVSVGITPELLPMIITINLSIGAIRMSKQKVIVKRLQSIQNLGSMDILCTDKTGTLTEGQLELHAHADAQGQPSARTLLFARLNSVMQASLRNPMDAAIARHGGNGLDGYIKVDEVPFDFSRRRMSVVVEAGGRRLLITKGAAESVLASCRQIELGGQVRDLTPDLRQQVEDRLTALSGQGYRAVAVAYRPIENTRAVYTPADETDLIYLGTVSFIDPPKATAAQSIRDLLDLGVSVKILTGDNELVTQRICERVGVEVRGVLMGQDVDALTDDELAERAGDATICARLSPEQKDRIITVLKKAGHVVGYMGDGINDAPSLRAADVGISVNNAVDVAKASADIILLEEGLHILKEGVLGGRRTFANTLKYIMMGTSSNFGNMFSVPVASVLVPFLPMLPVQILLNNFLYDFSQVSIPTDKVDHDLVSRPRRWNIRFIRNFMIVFGPISSLYDIMTYLVMLFVFHAGAALFQTGWFVESLATQTLVIHVIRSRHSLLRSRASGLLWLTTLVALGLGVLIPYTPVGAFFGFVPLPLPFFGVLMATVAAYLLMVEAAKRWFVGRFGW